MRRRLSLTAALVLLLSLLCACAAQHAQEMDENGYELYFLSDPNSAGGGDAIRTQEKRLTLDFYIRKFLAKPKQKLDGTVLNILRIAVYQMMYLDRVPDSAADGGAARRA